MRSAVVVAILLAALFLLRALAVAPTYQLSTDEAVGLTEALDASPVTLLWGRGLDAELNATPLHYFIDKARLSLSEGWLRHSTPPVFFRALPLLLVSGYLFLMVLLAYSLAVASGVAWWARLVFSAGAGLMLLTNGQLLYGVALQDRPYALWLFLSAAQLLMFFRAGAKPSRGLAVVGALLSYTTFAAAPQAAVASAVRWWRFRERRIFLEALPALLIGAVFFFLRHDQLVGGQRGFLELWAHALVAGTLHPSSAAGDMTAGFAPVGYPEELALTWTAVILATATLARGGRFLVLQSFGVVMAALPVTLGSLLLAHYFEPRYLFFIYPCLALLHLCAVLALAERAGRWAWAVVVVWADAQVFYRAPNLLMDAQAVRMMSAPLRAEAKESCPASWRDLRHPQTGRLDTLKLRQLCGDGVAGAGQN